MFPGNMPVAVAELLTKKIPSNFLKPMLSTLTKLYANPHKHIVPIFGYALDEVKGGYEGALITKRMRESLKDAALSPLERIVACLDIAKGLQHMHALGLVHLDVSPDNVMTDGTGLARSWCLIDFGVSRPLTMAIGNDHQSMSVFVGKRKYACPTFKQNLRVSFATDVFSFGVSALVVLSGASNFEDREELISETKLDSRQISAWARNPALFARLRKLIENCCATTPADRMSLAPVVDAVLDSLRAGPTHSETVVRGCLLLPVSVIMFSMTRSVPYADFLTVG